MKETTSNIKLIISGCCDKNPASEKKLFELYYGYVHAICRRYGKSQEEIEEMVNDTFYTVFRYLKSYDPQYDFTPWLSKVCVNCCLKYLNKYTSDMHVQALDTYSNSISVESNPDINDSIYLNCIRLLPPVYRTVFNLYVFEEYKHHEIAEKLNISVGTSKSNLSRAKSKLYDLLSDLRESKSISG